jgi:hypothetical protein
MADDPPVAVETVEQLRAEIAGLRQALTAADSRETATADILRAIAASPAALSPVLDAVAEWAARLCDADDVVIQHVVGDTLVTVAARGPWATVVDVPRTLTRNRDTVSGRCVVDRQTIHIRDLEAEPESEYPRARAPAPPRPPYDAGRAAAPVG